MLLAYAQLSGRAFASIFAPLLGQRGWRLSALWEQMVNIGVASMPTVALANFLLGIVLAIQGAGQFAKLGATDLVANLVAFSILREIGPLITAAGHEEPCSAALPTVELAGQTDRASHVTRKT